LVELSRVMAPQGMGFLHHSNLGAHLVQLRLSRVLERAARSLPVAKRALQRWQIVEWDYARGKTMTAKRFPELCHDAGLVCVGQEIIDWGPRMIDCLSLVTRPGSQWNRLNVVVKNPDFMREAHSAGKVAGVYTSLRSSPVVITETEPTIRGAIDRALPGRPRTLGGSTEP
jgi:hypothetical protein